MPAPEPTHALAAAIREALACKESGESKVILTALCGHGHLDLAAYQQYLSGEMIDYELPDAEIAAAMVDVPVLDLTAPRRVAADPPGPGRRRARRRRLRRRRDHPRRAGAGRGRRRARRRRRRAAARAARPPRPPVRAGRGTPVGRAGSAGGVRPGVVRRRGAGRAARAPTGGCAASGSTSRWPGRSTGTASTPSCPACPVRVQHRTGAMWVLNSAALAATGLADLDDPGVERDADGRATGRLYRLDDVLRARLGAGRSPTSPTSAGSCRRTASPACAT